MERPSPLDAPTTATRLAGPAPFGRGGVAGSLVPVTEPFTSTGRGRAVPHSLASGCPEGNRGR